MKLSELKSLIREEIKKANRLNEAKETYYSHFEAMDAMADGYTEEAQEALADLTRAKGISANPKSKIKSWVSEKDIAQNKKLGPAFIKFLKSADISTIQA